MCSMTNQNVLHLSYLMEVDPSDVFFLVICHPIGGLPAVLLRSSVRLKIELKDADEQSLLASLCFLRSAVKVKSVKKTLCFMFQIYFDAVSVSYPSLKDTV